ncbi:hypothetical protein TELCIR_19883 [Teladorsagia circumcincta]|uniref:Laminin G domain-containing protein n=1 Tax=Teladorsagia circumcincta TaxID=45464 RepID=A0A2G9TL56_TELCI|nr:hypothetical protein TELCIR_19883 [Teladorsagia circumcincta]
MGTARRTITFKVDGIGKQALSRVVLPSIISADLKSVQLGINDFRGQFSGCLRRLVVNGELQSLGDDEKYSSEFFTKTVSGDVTTGCSFGSARLALLQKPGVLASLLCVAVFVAAASVVLAVARVIRRRESSNEITWQRTEEIDAYAMHKPGATTFGHINRAMASSSEGPIYASADGYETPIHLVSFLFWRYQEKAIFALSQKAVQSFQELIPGKNKILKRNDSGDTSP